MVKDLLKLVGRTLRLLNPFRAVRWMWFTLRNLLRRRAKLDYVMFTLGGEIPALPGDRGFIQQRLFGEVPMSLIDLDKHFRQIGLDPRPKGVILYLRNLQLSLADLQTLRDSIIRLREMGKRVVCYAQEYDLADYFIASAADEIILQPGGLVSTLGLRQEVIFLKDALEQVGIGIDAVAISPYKGALDQLTRSDVSPEGREQFEWLLESRYEIIVNAIAEGRKITPEAVRTLIDTAPHLDTAALPAKHVDAVLNEEDLAQHLQAEHLVPWERARRMLFKHWRKSHAKYIALIEITGTIIPGESQQPPPIPLPIPLPFFGDNQSGDISIVRMVRHLMEDEAAAAVVLYIDSPGGSAAASEAMTAALEQLAKSRPVVACMNAVAASGGYYVATPAQWIVAQPGTITGSIGVLTGKPISTGIFDKLQINRRSFERGTNVGIFSDLAPFNDTQRQIVRGTIERIYDQFTARVATSRKMTQAEVDAVGGGRVWTGVQAKERGLVDELGGLSTALKRACELANLPEDAPLELFRDHDKSPLPPQVAEAVNPAAGLTYLYSRVRLTLNGSAQVLLPFFIR
jgi:protease-4